MKKFVLLFAVLFTAGVFADETVSPVIAIGATLFDIFKVAIATLVTGIITMVVARIGQKFNLEIDGKIKEEIGLAIRTGIASAESWAKKQDKPTGNQKLDYALNVVKSLAGTEIGKRFTDEQLKSFIEAHLFAGKVDDKAMPIVDLKSK